MITQLTRILSILTIPLATFFTGGSAIATTIINGSDILNTDFGVHVGIVADINAQGQEGIFIYRTLGEAPVLSIYSADIEAAALEYTGRYLVAYDESGQALYKLPENRYQMQITTPNGAINLNYVAGGRDLHSVAAVAETQDILLRQSPDGLYSIYLLGTGELSVIMGPDVNDINYQITFTGVPALNVSLTTYSTSGE